jgi:GT2 family glycosyltransferase
VSALIGIVSKDREHILPKALSSAIGQDYRPLSVAVFDDCSSDNTRALKKDYPDVQWEFSAETKGYLFARNKFMRETEADYYCSLDDDSWFQEPSSLKNAIAFLSENPEVAVVAFDILSPDRPKGLARTAPYEVANFIGCGHVLRLSAVKEVGFYDVNPFYYGSEEKDLCIKLMDRHYKIMLMPGVTVWHDKTNVARDERKQNMSVVCNDLVFFYRRSPMLYLLPGLILKIINMIKFAAFYKRAYLLKSTLKGISAFFGLMLASKIYRKPVKVPTFQKYFAMRKISAS